MPPVRALQSPVSIHKARPSGTRLNSPWLKPALHGATGSNTKGVLVQIGTGIGDNGIWRIAKLNGILYLLDVGSKDDIILLCLRWYFRFKLSYRDLVAILGERGLSISHTTILRWVVHYSGHVREALAAIRATGGWELAG